MTTLWDILVANGDALPTKSRFGEIMHDSETSEEEKERVLEQMKDAGGYENLPDD